jgi:hypothetical protein
VAAVEVMKTGFGAMDATLSTSTARLPVLQRRLWTLGRWYDAARVDAYADAADGRASDKLGSDTSATVGSIWSSIHRKDRSVLVGSQPEVELESFLKAGFDSDAELLRALFSTYQPPITTPPGPPLSSGPALMFLADGFRSMAERLDALTPVHDFGCLYLDCAANPGAVPAKPETRTELSTIFRLLASLHDKPALTAALDEGDQAAAASTAYFSSSRWTPWRNLFDLVRAGHETVVQPAVRQLREFPADSYDPAWVTTAPPGSPRALFDLAGTVAHARERHATYVSVGQFQYPKGRLLPTGLLSSKIQDIKSLVNTTGQQLDAAVNDYRTNVQSLVTARLGDIDNARNEAELASRKQGLLQQAFSLSADDAGLKVTASIDPARSGDVTARISEVLATLETEGAAYTPSVLVPMVAIGSGASAWTGGVVNDVRSIAVTGVRGGGSLLASGVAGDIAQLEVGGTWSPTCALQAQNGSFAGIALDAPAVLRDAKTTSDGFSLSYSGGSFHAQSHSFTTSQAWSASAEVCAGGGFFFVSAKACAGYSTARTTADSTSSGSESRTGAAFAVGLRLPQTPFRDFPAGALIAVQVAPGTGTMLDATVVQSPLTALVFKQPADVYLVVNDLHCNAPGTGQLNLSATQLRPAGAKARALASAMGAIWAAKSSEMEAIVSQGRMLPDQAAAFRSDAWQALRTACSAELQQPCEPTAYPPVLQGFFASWIDTQVVNVERSIEHLRIGREFDQLNLQVNAVTADIDAVARKGRYASLMPYWTLQNLNLAEPLLRTSVDNYMSMIREVLHPMVHLRYPEALQGVSGADQFLTQDWYNVTISNVATSLKNFGQSLTGKLDLAVIQAASSSSDALVTDAIVRFQNPYLMPYPDVNGFTGRVVTDGRSTAIWDAINAFEPVTFDLKPEDLYQDGAVSNLLPCTLVAPSIKKMAFYVSTSSPQAATRNMDTSSAPTNFGRYMLFPTKMGNEILEFGNEEWLTTNPKFLYGVESEATRKFAEWDLSTYTLGPAGISPFDTWAVGQMVDQNGVNLGNPFGDATEFLVVMQLEARRVSTKVPGVGTCQGP